MKNGIICIVIVTLCGILSASIFHKNQNSVYKRDNPTDQKAVNWAGKTVSDTNNDGIPDFTLTVITHAPSLLELVFSDSIIPYATSIACAVDAEPVTWRTFSNSMTVVNSATSFASHTLKLKIQCGTRESAVLSYPFRIEDIVYVAPSPDGNDANSGAKQYPLLTIQRAVETAALRGATKVYVRQGVYGRDSGLLVDDERGGIIITNNNIRLYGGWDSAFSGRSGYSELNGGGIFRIIYAENAANIIIDGFDIKGGNHLTGNGGGIYFNTVNYGIITNCKVNNNKAKNGGGIYINGSACSVSGYVFANEAFESGGGMYLFNTTNRAAVYGNQARGHGGGIYGYNVIVLGSVHDNSAVSNGGGVLASTGCTIDAVIYGNSAANGGGVCIDGSYNYITGGRIYRNSASAYGGGVCVLYYSAYNQLKAELFTNTAKYGGGAAFFGGSFNTVTNSIYSNAADFGGGICLAASVYASGGSMYTNYAVSNILSADVSYNTARTNGGGICDLSATHTFTFGPVYGNNAIYSGGMDNGCGGGMFLGGSNAFVSNRIYENNSGYLGGGLYLDGNNNTVCSRIGGWNTSGQYATGILITGSNNTLSNAAVVSNAFAPGVGSEDQNGIVYCDRGTNNSIINSIIGAPLKYGVTVAAMYAIYESGAFPVNFTISNTVFITNTVSNLYSHFGSVVTNHEISVLNAASTRHGISNCGGNTAGVW